MRVSFSFQHMKHILLGLGEGEGLVVVIHRLEDVRHALGGQRNVCVLHLVLLSELRKCM